MKLVMIDLDGDGMPEGALAHLTREDLIYLATVTGRAVPAEVSQVMPGGEEANDSIYEATATLFNRFYGDGVDEARRNL